MAASLLVTVGITESQIPNQPGWGGVTIQNLDTTNSVDISTDPNFGVINTFTVTAGEQYITQGSEALYARVTPGQSGSPQTVNVWVTPGANAFAAGAPVVKISNSTPVYVTLNFPYCSQYQSRALSYEQTGSLSLTQSASGYYTFVGTISALDTSGSGASSSGQEWSDSASNIFFAQNSSQNGYSEAVNVFIPGALTPIQVYNASNGLVRISACFQTNVSLPT